MALPLLPIAVAAGSILGGLGAWNSSDKAIKEARRQQERMIEEQNRQAKANRRHQRSIASPHGFYDMNWKIDPRWQEWANSGKKGAKPTKKNISSLDFNQGRYDAEKAREEEMYNLAKSRRQQEMQENTQRYKDFYKDVLSQSQNPMESQYAKQAMDVWEKSNQGTLDKELKAAHANVLRQGYDQNSEEYRRITQEVLANQATRRQQAQLTAAQGGSGLATDEFNRQGMASQNMLNLQGNAQQNAQVGMHEAPNFAPPSPYYSNQQPDYASAYNFATQQGQNTGNIWSSLGNGLTQMAGTMYGQQLGQQYGQNPYGQNPYMMQYNKQMYPSDIRMKENIEPVGKLNNGLNVYVFNYKGNPQRQIGLIAQEVEQLIPQAVAQGDDGMLQLDYDLATQMNENYQEQYQQLAQILAENYPEVYNELFGNTDNVQKAQNAQNTSSVSADQVTAYPQI